MTTVTTELTKEDLIQLARKRSAVPIPKNWVGHVGDDSLYNDGWQNVIVEFSPPVEPVKLDLKDAKLGSLLER